MKTQAIALLIVGLLAGALGSRAVDAKNHRPTTSNAPAMSGMDHGMSAGDDMADMSMNAMTSELKGVTGDEFDKKFIASMIAHHQGAIDMANTAKTQSKHEEIKKMADDIVSAQTKEIGQMKEWQKQWGY